MAYASRGSTGNRATTAVVVALLQGAAIYALVTGLAVVFVPQDKPDRIVGEQIPLTPPPSPTPDRVEPKKRDIVDPVRDRTALPKPMPTNDGVETDGGLFNRGGTVETGGGGGTIAEPLPPKSQPTIASIPAKPLNSPASWASADDYPTRDIRAENEGTTRFRLAIGADGKVQGCDIVGTSGFASLDALTCRLVSRRARFSGAIDSYGAPTAGTYTSAIRWQIPKD